MTETPDAGRDPVNPPREELLAERLAAKPGPGTRRVIVACVERARPNRPSLLRRGGSPSPSQLDVPLRRLAKFADFSKPWFIVATLLALFGGNRGRRAAITGIAAIGVTSFAVNQPMKLVSARTRPDRDRAGVPQERWVSMPESTSFPSGHSASAAAFATAVGDVIPGSEHSVAGSGSPRRVYSRLYRRALSQRCRGRGDGRRPVRPAHVVGRAAHRPGIVSIRLLRTLRELVSREVGRQFMHSGNSGRTCLALPVHTHYGRNPHPEERDKADIRDYPQADTEAPIGFSICTEPAM